MGKLEHLPFEFETAETMLHLLGPGVDTKSDGSPLIRHPEYTHSALGLPTTAPTQPHNLWVRVRITPFSVRRRE